MQAFRPQLALALVVLVLAVAQAARPVESDALAAAAAAGAAMTSDGDEAALPLLADPKPPRFPGSYTVRYTFSLPYTAKLQPDGIRYPVVFYRDEEGQATRMDTYDSTNILITTKDVAYEVVPRIDRQICMVFDQGGDEPTAVGSAARAGNGMHLMSALPDISGWEYAGTAALEGGRDSHIWQYEARHAAKTVVYRLHVSADSAATPLRLHMQGKEMFSGSHFDEYVVEYSEFIPGRPDPSVFHKPTLCKGVAPQAAPARTRGRTAMQMRMAAAVPTVSYRGEHAEYDEFLASHGAVRQHASLDEYRLRAAVFQANHDMIQAHNARNASYTMAMNRFGDYTRDEFLALMLPKKARQLGLTAPLRAGAHGTAAGSVARSLKSSAQEMEQQVPEGGEHGWGEQEAGPENRHKLRKHELPYEPMVDPAAVPAALTWRGTGADGIGAMDQATCGSCWAFSAAGAMEAAWFRATGQQVSFSEQQIVDCSWDYLPHDPASNLGCDGGNHWAAIGHIVEAGGIALTRDYAYKGQDGFCAANTTHRVGRFKGFASVPRYDNAALREAVYSRGPIAISFDASQPSFAFYSSGVYREEQCAYTPSGLDHDILLVGYGTSPEGDFWEVKNSWSDHWGDGGYFKVAVDNHACGVTTDAVYALVADSV